jgi:hypothetical protein
MASLTRRLTGIGGGGSGGAAAFGTLTGSPTDNAGLSAALSAKVDTTGNRYGFNTPAIPTETPLAAATTTATPITDGFTTVSSDGDGTGNTHQDWGGLQRGIATRMTDGTLFLAYIQNNAGTDRIRLMRSPTGGGAGAWTQVTTIATTLYKSISLRDKTRDQLILVTCEGTSPNLIMKLRVFDNTGAQVGSTYSVNTAGKGFCQTMNDQGFYYEAGISHAQDSNGKTRVVLGGWTLPLPAGIQQNTTMCCYKQVQWLFWDGANWTQEPVERYMTGVRMDYDNMIVGADGDPDMVYGIYQGNVAMWESAGQFTPERLAPFRLSPIAAYAFDRFGTWSHNRRTGEWTFQETSPQMDWTIRPWDGTGGSYDAAKDIPEARTRQAIFNAATGEWWIVYKCQKPNKYTTSLNATGSISGNVLTISAITGTPLTVGTVVVSHSLATTGFLASKIIGINGTPGAGTLTGAGGTGTYLLDTPQTLGSGTVGFAQPGVNSTVSPATTSSWRVQIVTLKGKVKYDGDLLAATGFGLMGLTQVASGRVYAMFLALGSDTTNTWCHFWELTRTADGEVNAITVNLASSYNSDNNPIAGNVGFGCVTAYLGGAITAPARASNQGPIFPDYQHGSKPTTNTVDVFISRRATDHNAGGTLTTTGDSTGHKMDHMRMRVPA